MGLNRDAHASEDRNDVADGELRWITVGPADRPCTSIVLEPSDAGPRMTAGDRRRLAGAGAGSRAQMPGSRP